MLTRRCTKKSEHMRGVKHGEACSFRMTTNFCHVFCVSFKSRAFQANFRTVKGTAQRVSPLGHIYVNSHKFFGNFRSSQMLPHIVHPKPIFW